MSHEDHLKQKIHELETKLEHQRSVFENELDVRDWRAKQALSILATGDISAARDALSAFPPKYTETDQRNLWKIQENFWEKNLLDVIGEIREMTKGPYEGTDSEKWSWVRNMHCKYVTIRIDMRDGGFVLCNRYGQRISMDELRWQYNSERDDGRS